MFDPDNIVVTGLAGKMQQMYRFGIDVMFGSGNFAVTSKVNVKVTMPRSKVGEPK